MTELFYLPTTKYFNYEKVLSTPCFRFYIWIFDGSIYQNNHWERWKYTNNYQNYWQQTLIVGSTKESELVLFEGRYVDEGTFIYVCRDNTWKLPVDSVEGALEQLQNF